MRLIDADAFTGWIISELRKVLIRKKGCFDDITGRAAANMIGKKIDEAPGFVLCCGCKNWDNNSGLSARMCKEWEKYTTQREFCSRGRGQTDG